MASDGDGAASAVPSANGPPTGRGMSRPRVLQRLRSCLDHRMTLLVAPAGAGKTTALMHLAEDLDRRHAWYQADTTESSPAALLDGVRRALAPALGVDLAPWPDVAAMVGSLRAVEDPSPTALFVDDLQAIAGEPVESTFEGVVRHLPEWMTVLAASRRPPSFNVPDLLVQGLVAEVDADVLRWRPWEVEQLFQSFYRVRLQPEEAARLTQRTEGWAAGLQLFHLATRGMAPASRQAMIDSLHTTPGLVRDYLTRNVLHALGDELRRFMVDTCVLGRLDADLCDALRETDDSARWLAELEHRRLFLLPLPDGEGHRYHEVLRAYLELSLLERDGPVDTRARHGQAGRLLEARGFVAEAVHAHARAEAWDDVTRVLGSDGEVAIAGNDSTLPERLPEALVESDPWLQLSRARSLVGEGRLAEAVDAYRTAQESFGRVPAVQTFNREFAAVETWARDRDTPPRSPTDWLRKALRGDPRGAASQVVGEDPGTMDLLVAAVASLLAGAVDDARRLVRRVGTSAGCEALPLAVARALDHVVDLACGAPTDPDDLLWAVESLEQIGVPWLARLGQVVALGRSGFEVPEAELTWRMVDDEQDPWGRAIFPLVLGIAAVCHGASQPGWLDEAAVAGRDLGAPVLEAWARAWEALELARSVDDAAGLRADQARSLARSILVPGAEAIADLATATVGGPGAADAMARARSLARELGLVLPVVDQQRSRVKVVEAAPGTSARCFGGLQLTINGRTIDLDGLRPQARTVLALLTLHAPVPVHRGCLLEALWPGGDPTVTARRLPVLISTLRRHLEPRVEPGDWSLLVRVGEAHALRLGPEAWCDVAVFDDAVAAARRAGGGTPEGIAALQVAFDAWGGELLPEFGPADWVVRPREDYRLGFARVAQALARERLRDGDPGRGVQVARAGLQADRFSSQLWELLAAGHRRTGDLAAAARAEQNHREVLNELGVSA